MKEVYFALSAFIGIYLLYLFLIVLRKKGLQNFQNSTEITYLTKRYKIKVDKKNIKSLAHTVALANAFVVSITVLCVGVIDNFILQIIVAMGLLVPIILIIYHIVGTIYQKKEKKKHV